jgi:hypothetical protein
VALLGQARLFLPLFLFCKTFNKLVDGCTGFSFSLLRTLTAKIIICDLILNVEIAAERFLQQCSPVLFTETPCRPRRPKTNFCGLYKCSLGL